MSAQWIRAIAVAVVEAATRTRTLYRGRVISQHTDGTIDVQLVDGRLPTLAHVPIRTLPGVEPRVRAGTLVDVTFEHGRLVDPPAPIATLFEATGLESIRITASQSIELEAPLVKLGADAARALVLDGDIGTFVAPVTPVGPITGTFQISGTARKALGS